MVRLYEAHPDMAIVATLSQQLWPHFVEIVKFEDSLKVAWCPLYDLGGEYQLNY